MAGFLALEQRRFQRTDVCTLRFKSEPTLVSDTDINQIIVATTYYLFKKIYSSL